jgi:flavin-dependent dehydrogenase
MSDAAGAARRDVAVVGGGPGGSTAANLLAAAGRDVVVYERETFPRFHIGESLLPHNMRIFERLGVVPAMRARFMEKWGVEFLSSGGDLTRMFHFEEALEPRYPMCFQTPRADLDALLLEEAGRRGATVRLGATVRAAEPDPGGGWRLTVEEQGATRVERTRFLVDASGRDGLLARRGGLRRMDAKARRAAVFAHFTGVPRRAGRDAGNIVIILLRDGWFWIIPFADGRTSVGVVVDGPALGAQRATPEAALERAIERCPAARRLLGDATRVSPVYTTSDWAYGARGIAGADFMMVGDATAFVDPVFSTGVLLAMSSAEMAAAIVDAALDTGSIPPARRRAYEREVTRHVAGYHRLVSTFYSTAFPRLCFFPESRLGIPEAVLNLLAGDMDPSWRVRWRLAFFYGLGALYHRFDLGPRVPLLGVFEAADGRATAGSA